MMSYRSKRAKEIALCLLLAALLPEFARSQRVPPDPRPDEQLPPATQFSPSPDCPCLSQQDVYDKIMRSNVSSSLRPMPQVSCPDNGLPASVKDKGGVYRVLCLPPQLGSDVCRAWDSILFEVCNSNKNVMWWSQGYALRAASTNPAMFSPADQEKLCGHGWCYVDANNCTTPPHRASTLFPDSDLHYSYETCGFVETFGPRRLLEELAEFNNGNPIRVSFPGNDAYRLYRTKDGEITGSFHEVFIGVQELINAVKQEPVPFQMDVPITDAAKEFVRHEFGLDSSYTACAAMIALNQTDICIGPFWSLPERHAMAQYIYSFAADEFYLITFLVRPGGDLLLGPFLPFTADVWIMLVASVLLSILAFAWLEITPRMQATYALMKVKNQAMPMPATRMEKVKNSIRCFLEVVLMSMEGVLDFHPEGYNCMSNAGKLLKMGYIMFMVLFMATYTANLASILVSSQSKVEFNDLSGAIDAGVRICVPEVLVKKLSLLHPRLQPYVIPTGFEDVMDTMDTGVCRVGISYDAINDVKQNKHCNKVEVGSPLVVLPVSNLAQPHLAQAINAAIEAQVGPGLADQIQRKYVSNYIYENQIEPCVVDTVTSNDKLNVIAMAGLFSLLAIIVFTAILLDTCERSFPKISGYRGGIEFKLARRAGGTCYLRDDWKNTYVLRLPPGLHYPEKALYDNPEPDEDTQSDSGDEGPWQAPVQRAARPRPASGQEESTAPRPETANDVEVYPLPPVIRVEKGATPCDGSWASSAFGASPLLAADVRSGESVDHLFEECRSSAQQSDGRVSSLLIKEDAQEFMLLCDDEPSIAFGESLSKGDSRGQEYVDQQASAPAPEITNDVLVDPLPVSVRVEKGATPCDGSPASSAVAASPLLAVDAKSRESVDQLLEECHHGMPCDDEPADAAFEERESLSACDSRGEESYGKQDSAASNSQLDEVGRVSSLKAYFDKGMPSRRS